MRISRHENNRYTLTNEINRYSNDNLINTVQNSDTFNTFILEYTNPNNNPLFYESVMKLFTLDVNFGSENLPIETYLGSLSFRYYTAPLDLHIKTTSDITTTEKILASGLQILNSTEDELQSGINVSPGIPVIIGNYGVDNNTQRDKNSCVMFTATSDSAPQNIKFRNYGTADTRMIFQNVSGDLTDTFEGNFWAIQTNGGGAFKIQKGSQTHQLGATDIGTTFYKIETNGNHDFMSGNITTNGNITSQGTVTCGSITCNGDINTDRDIYTTGTVTCGSFTCNGDINTDRNIYTTGNINATGNIFTDGNINTAGEINTNGDITTYGNIQTYGSIDTIGNIDATGNGKDINKPH
jgi:hypothetical protein